MNNEQPLIADLFDAPSPGDVGLRCTNLRQLNGKRPVFVDDMKSVFFFPYLHVRFVEIPPAALASADSSLATIDDEASATDARADEPTTPPVPEPEPDLEIDEDFLRRIREA